MKKLNFFVALIAVLLAFFSSCKSTPPEEKVEVVELEENLLYVNPLELLERDSTFYISLPPDVDPDLTQRIIQKYFASAAGQASQIMSRFSTVYAGVYNSKNTSSVQIAAEGNIPKNLAKLAFTKKNGWDENFIQVLTDIPDDFEPETLITKETNYKYYTNSAATDMQIALPSSKIACIAHDLTNMLTRYDALGRGQKHTGGPNISEDIKIWLTAPKDEIRFYAGNPISFLTILTGANLNLRLSFVKAVMIPNPDFTNSYLLDIEFEFLNERVVTAGQGILNLAFGLTNSKIVRNSPTNLAVLGIEIQKEQLYRLLSL